MKLYSFIRSPNPAKVRFALAELGQAYETVEVDLFKGQARSEEFLRLNPHGKVPVLEDGDLILPESNAILTYLGKKYGGDLWVRDEVDEAQAMRWLFFEAVHMAPHCGTVWWSDVVAPRLGAKDSSDAVLAEATEELSRSLGVLEGHLATREYMLGSSARFTLVDCAVATTLSMLRTTRLDDPERWPAVAAYLGRVRGRSSWTAGQGDAFIDFPS